jgi:hypothetical protein
MQGGGVGGWLFFASSMMKSDTFSLFLSTTIQQYISTYMNSKERSKHVSFDQDRPNAVHTPSPLSHRPMIALRHSDSEFKSANLI